MTWKLILAKLWKPRRSRDKTAETTPWHMPEAGVPVRFRLEFIEGGEGSVSTARYIAEALRNGAWERLPEVKS